MLVVFIHFGTFFRVTFSSLWSTARLFFTSKQPIQDPEIGLRPLHCNGAPSRPFLHLASCPRVSKASPVIPEHTAPAASPRMSLRPLLLSTNPVPSHGLYARPPDVPPPVLPTKTPRMSKYNLNRKISSPRMPLKTITNNYGNVLQVPRECVVVKHPYPSPTPDATCPPSPSSSLLGSLGWQDEKEKVLNEARTWNTRVKTDHRRRSLPVISQSQSQASTAPANRRASAPACLGEAHLSLEECLKRVVSRASPSPIPEPLDTEEQFIIGEQDSDSDGSEFEGDVTYIPGEEDVTITGLVSSPSPDSSTDSDWDPDSAPTTPIIGITPVVDIAERSELPYLLSACTLKSIISEYFDVRVGWGAWGHVGCTRGGFWCGCEGGDEEEGGGAGGVGTGLAYPKLPESAPPSFIMNSVEVRLDTEDKIFCLRIRALESVLTWNPIYEIADGNPEFQVPKF
ncbi:hypothetical protein FB45DRAFT_1001541 [Roridomyces roridus]|uniref:Uncharacterized protein n=1 Tax=Roridomyces roridus TaxID=1738132 RepID=A0AAD7FPN7_9AGAR|nr:hypothetical protein FB45DRAFT_1001541 [Roridomyces roridus]